jgi:hypothetical protein
METWTEKVVASVENPADWNMPMARKKTLKKLAASLD